MNDGKRANFKTRVFGIQHSCAFAKLGKQTQREIAFQTVFTHTVWARRHAPRMKHLFSDMFINLPANDKLIRGFFRVLELREQEVSKVSKV